MTMTFFLMFLIALEYLDFSSLNAFLKSTCGLSTVVGDFLKNYFIVVQLQLSAFSPHPSPQPSQTSGEEGFQELL